MPGMGVVGEYYLGGESVAVTPEVQAKEFTFTAGLSFTGTESRKTTKKLSAAVSFVAKLARARSITSALNFTGATTKGLIRSPAAAFAFVGAVVRNTAKRPVAVVGFAGVVSRATMHNLSSALSFAGLVGRGATEILETATLGFTGVTTRYTIKPFQAAVSYTGAVKKKTVVVFQAAMAFFGSLGTTLKHAGGRVIFETLTSAVSFSSTVSRATTKVPAAVLSFGSSLNKQPGRTLLTAMLGFIGEVNTNVTRAGIHAFTEALSAAVGFSANVSRVTGKVESATLSFTGSVGRGGTQILTAVLSFTGSTSRTALRAFTSALSFTGSMGRSAAYVLASVLDFTVSLVRQHGFANLREMALQAGLFFEATLNKLSIKRFFAEITPFVDYHVVRRVLQRVTFIMALPKRARLRAGGWVRKGGGS